MTIWSVCRARRGVRAAEHRSDAQIGLTGYIPLAPVSRLDAASRARTDIFTLSR